MNQTNNETQKRKWGCGGCLLAFVVVLALLILIRTTLVWQDRESQTKQLYALAAQLGYAADSEVLQDRDWYCIDWDMFGRKKCAVFLAYTTTLDAEQMQVLAKTVGVVDAYDRSNAPNYFDNVRFERIKRVLAKSKGELAKRSRFQGLKEAMSLDLRERVRLSRCLTTSSAAC